MVGRSFPMSVEEFRLFRELLRELAGLHFDDTTRERLERRLQERLAVTGSRSFTDYYLKLRNGPDAVVEQRAMLEHCLTHETYFFREPRQLRALEEEILPEVIARVERTGAPRRLRLWSAGCSTGEEPYTLAMILQRTPQLAGWDLEVLGTDLSSKALARARRGIYAPNSFRDMPPGVLDRWFKPVPGALVESWEVRPEVRAMVTLGRVNLWREEEVALVGHADVVLCRNVLIYFQRDSRARVIETIHRRLRPGGYLLLGHSENLLQTVTSFETVSLKNDLVYRRAVAPRGGPGASGLPEGA
jgi:chemotaxis protein methyltransferase CheR